MNGIRSALIGASIMALTSAFADAFWAAAIPEHRTIYGLVHGAIVLGMLGYVLARLGEARRPLLAAVAGMLIGLGAAALFYIAFALLGSPALVIAWMALWLAFAFLNEAIFPARETGSRALTRGVVAAVASGLAFWLVSGMWIGEHDPGPLYTRNVAYWFLAFLPGFAALLLGRPRHQAPGH